MRHTIINYYQIQGPGYILFTSSPLLGASAIFGGHIVAKFRIRTDKIFIPKTYKILQS